MTWIPNNETIRTWFFCPTYKKLPHKHKKIALNSTQVINWNYFLHRSSYQIFVTFPKRIDSTSFWHFRKCFSRAQLNSNMFNSKNFRSQLDSFKRYHVAFAVVAYLIRITRFIWFFFYFIFRSCILRGGSDLVLLGESKYLVL